MIIVSALLDRIEHTRSTARWIAHYLRRKYPLRTACRFASNRMRVGRGV